MELRLLRSFVAIAEELHFGRAAARLFIVQPALSKQIAALERELDVVLLERDRRQVVLTAAGRALLDDARRILAATDAAAGRARAAGRGTVGVLRLAFIAPVLYELLPEVLRSFRATHPEVRLELSEMHNREAVDAVLARRVAAAFVRLPAAGAADLHVLPVRSEPLCVAVPREDPLAARDRIEVADLRDVDLVLIGRDREPELHDAYVALCAAAGFTVRVAHEVDRTHVAVGLVACGLGVAVVPESARRAADPDVIYLPLDEPRARLVTGVAWRDDDPVLARFLAHVPRGQVARSAG